MIKIDDLLKAIFIEGLLKTLSWYKTDSPYFLRSIFDQVGFRDRDSKRKVYFDLPAYLSSKINYPVEGNKEILKNSKNGVLKEINDKHKGFSNEYLNGLSVNQLFFLIEKFGGSVPSDDSDNISIFDVYKIKAARAVIHSNQRKLGHKDNLFINIDMSGIQNFIYNISSTGALKNLRSRSFFIELLCYHTIQKVLSTFNLHYVNVLINGGGTIYILSSCPEDCEDKLKTISYDINKWLLKEFNGRLYATFSHFKCSDKILENDLGNILKELSNKTFKAKHEKFKEFITREDFPFIKEEDPVFQGCEICYKDSSTSKLRRVIEGEERFRCSICDRIIELGNQIPKTKFIYQYNSYKENCFQIEDSYYLISDKAKPDLTCLWAVYEDDDNFINYLKESAIHIFVKTYTKKNEDLPKKAYKKIVSERDRLESLLSSESDRQRRQSLEEETDALKDENTATLEYIAVSAKGAELIGALRMDADNIGKIFHDGFYGEMSLEGLSSFSRNLNYFFKIHLETLCGKGFERNDENNIFTVKANEGRAVHTIYAGGDDLFIIGAWSDITALAMDIGEAFKKYTCDNIDIGVSGGLTLHKSKFPIDKVAYESMSALNTAKHNYQPCWMCRNEWAACPLFELGKCLRKDSISLFFTDYMASRKKILDERRKLPKYSQESSRLTLALKWRRYDTETKKIVNEVNDYIIEPLTVFRKKGKKVSTVFFHNILTLLNTWYDEGFIYLPKIAWILQKFKSELRHLIDIEGEKSLYDLYEVYLHCNEGDRFSTLHIPLSWNILLMKGANEDEN